MPLDIQIPYKGSDYLFQGISQGASNLAAGGEAAIKKYRQIQDAGKAADYFMKAGGDDMYAQAGMHPEEWKTLGPRDKAAVVQGIMEQGTQKKLQAQLEDMHAQAMERQQMGAARQQQMDLQTNEAEGLPRMMQMMQEGRAAQGAPGPDGQTPQTKTGTFSPEEIMGAIGKMGATNPKVSAALINKFMPTLMGSTQSPQFFEDPVTHRRFVVGPHVQASDRPQFDPASLMGGMDAIPVRDENGEVLGYRVPNGKGGTAPAPKSAAAPPLPGTFHTAIDRAQQDMIAAHGVLDRTDEEFLNALGKPMSPALIKAQREGAQRRLNRAQAMGKSIVDRYHAHGYFGPDEKDDYYSQLGLETVSPGAAKPASGPIALPKDNAALKVGQLYNTKRGPAKWDGEKFVK